MSLLKNVDRIFGEADSHWVGDGFPVRTLFSHDRLGERLSPFLLLEYAGPLQFDPASEARGVDEHPHRGFETVTIVYQGELEHRDSSGNAGRIGPGDVQWMTAASGVVHEEKHTAEFTKKGGTFEMVQLWVNLPAKDKMSLPRYQTLLSGSIPIVGIADGRGNVRVISGRFNGKSGPAKTFTPVNVWDVSLERGSKFEFKIKPGFTALLGVLRGRLVVNGREKVKASEVVLFDRQGESVTTEADQNAQFLVLSGRPIEEPVAAYGPFVMNTGREIEQAISDYRNGRLGTLNVPIKHREAAGS